MKMRDISFLIVALTLLLGGVALAGSVEITSGSGQHEGITGRSGKPLRNGCLIQIIRIGRGSPQRPDAGGQPTLPDELLGTTEVGYNFPFSPDQGKFDCQVWVETGEWIYVRAWDGAGAYGDSEARRVAGGNAEIWNVGGDGDRPAFVVKLTTSEVK